MLIFICAILLGSRCDRFAIIKTPNTTISTLAATGKALPSFGVRTARAPSPTVAITGNVPIQKMDMTTIEWSTDPAPAARITKVYRNPHGNIVVNTPISSDRTSGGFSIADFTAPETHDVGKNGIFTFGSVYPRYFSRFTTPKRISVARPGSSPPAASPPTSP